MSIELKLTSVIFLLSILAIIINLIKKDKIFIKYSFVWILPCFVLLIFTLVPGFLTLVTKLLGFVTPSNMIFALLISFLLIVSIALTVIVSRQNEKIRLLVQEVSLLKKEMK